MKSTCAHPLISVIVPCYNYGHIVVETLEDLKKQSYSNWECIIVNDGSTDNTEEVVQEYIKGDNRYVYVYQENKGLSAARNTGINTSKGDFIQLLDADDFLEHEKFEKQIDYLIQNKEVDIVYGNVKYFYTDAASVYYKTVTGDQNEWMPKLSGRGLEIISALLKENIMAVNCPLIRRGVFHYVGLFNTDFPVLEDWEMWLRCALQNVYFHYLAVESTDALVRMHNISISRDRWRMRYYELLLKNAIHDQKLNATTKRTLSYEVDRTCLFLLSISLSNLLQGEFKKSFHQYKLLNKHCKVTKLYKAAGITISKKLKSSLSV